MGSISRRAPTTTTKRKGRPSKTAKKEKTLDAQQQPESDHEDKETEKDTTATTTPRRKGRPAKKEERRGRPPKRTGTTILDVDVAEPIEIDDSAGEEKKEDTDQEEQHDDDHDDDDDEEEKYKFNGIEYTTYQEMVNAKRERNANLMVEMGLLDALHEAKLSAAAGSSSSNKKATSARGITPNTATSGGSSRRTNRGDAPQRKSSRLAGIPTQFMYVEDEQNSRFSVGGDGTEIPTLTPSGRKSTTEIIYETKELTLQQAMDCVFDRYVPENLEGAVSKAEVFLKQDLLGFSRCGVAPAPDNVTSSLKQEIKEENKVVGATTIPESERKRKSPRSVVTVPTTTNLSPDTPVSNLSTSLAAAATSWNVVKEWEENDLVKAIDALRVETVAKVTPDRIYGMAVHPNPHQLIVCAGDKEGHVGIWNVDHKTSINCNYNSNGSQTDVKNETLDTDQVDDAIAPVVSSKEKEKSDTGIHLFRVHTSAANCLEWNQSGTTLYSMSYDGTIRSLDVNHHNPLSFQQVFSHDLIDTYSDGFYDSGRRYTQYMERDHRSSNADTPCWFLSTSNGLAVHLDLRIEENNRITFCKQLSEKKINSVSLHPDGYSFLSSGLDCCLKLWDLRMMEVGSSSSSATGSSKRKRDTNLKMPQPIASYNCGKSINSAFFSPVTGKYIMTVTQANKLDIFENFHLASESAKGAVNKSNILKPVKSIVHDNHTGRWLTTFLGKWHPNMDDLFCMGSMQRPRAMEVFSTMGGTTTTAAPGRLLRAISGEDLTAVASRCCFHPSTENLTLVGGNSSGRVTVIR